MKKTLLAALAVLAVVATGCRNPMLSKLGSQAKYSVMWAASPSEIAAAEVFEKEGGGALPARVAPGAVLRFTVKNETGEYRLSRVEAGGGQWPVETLEADESGVYTYTVRGNITVTAVFAAADGLIPLAWEVDPPEIAAAEGVFAPEGGGELPDKAAEGETVRFTVTDEIGEYRLFKVDAGGEALEAEGGVYSYTVQGGAVVITARFSAADNLIPLAWEVDPPEIAAAEGVFAPEGGGELPDKAAEGETVRFTVTDEIGEYRLFKVDAGGEALEAEGGVYSYTVQGGAVVITARFSSAPMHLVTVNSTGEGHYGGGEWPEGSTVTVHAGTPGAKGAEFRQWASGTEGFDAEEELADRYAAETSFTMPAYDVELEAEFGPAKYAITVATAEGVDPLSDPVITVKVNGIEGETAARYEDYIEVSVTLSSRKYFVKKITVACEEDEDFEAGVYAEDEFTFFMPAGDVTVTLAEVGEMESGTGDASVTINVDADFAGLEDAALSRGADASLPGSVTFKLESAGAFAEVKWYVDGREADESIVGGESGEELEIVAAGWDVKTHTLSVEVTLASGPGAGQKYSKEVRFTVTR